MARLERLREQVADLGIIPRREGRTGLPTELYYLKVKELAELVADPSLAPGYIEMARHRSKKRRRKKYLKDKAIEEQFPLSGHSDRLRSVLAFPNAQCLGGFMSETRFISETGFSKAKHGYIYQAGDRRIALTVEEANQAWVALGIPLSHITYREPDLRSILTTSEDRLYRGLMGDA